MRSATDLPLNRDRFTLAPISTPRSLPRTRPESGCATHPELLEYVPPRSPRHRQEAGSLGHLLPSVDMALAEGLSELFEAARPQRSAEPAVPTLVSAG